MKRLHVIATWIRLSRRYNAMLKCRVFNAFPGQSAIDGRLRAVRPRPPGAKSVPTAAFCHFFELIPLSA
jgi:hypothetical protein